jgi:hypothetical protein
MKADIRTKSNRPGCTLSVPCIIKPLWWQEKGLLYSASGCGAKIPTQYMVKFNNRWRRVYCKIYSNIGTLYIGKFSDGLFINGISED